MKKLTVSIVNYNGGDYLIKCLDSLKKAESELEFDVYVVDNKSSDGSFEMAKEKFPQFEYIKNSENLGFGKAHNQIFKKAKTQYVLTLNPDCELPLGTLSYMVDFMDRNENVGVSTCKIEKSDGTLDIAAHRGFPTPYASFLYFFMKNDRLYHLTNRDMTKDHEIDSAVGAFMLMRRSVLDKVGFFDEDYFLYAEDIDLCFRIKQAGYKVMYVPEVKIKHVKGASSGIKEHSTVDSNATIATRNLALEHFYKTMAIFYKKHYARNHPALFNHLVLSGINLKLQMAKRRKVV